MNKFSLQDLSFYAKKYIWWKSSEESIKMPLQVVAQVMNLGDYDDVLTLMKLVGEDYLQEALTKAEPGSFSEKSWHYWHYRLRLAKLGEVPPLPKRKLA